MKRKIIVTLSIIGVAVLTAIFVAGCSSGNRSAAQIETPVAAKTDNDANTKPEGNVEASTNLLTPDPNAAATTRDVLIAAANARQAPALTEGTWLNAEPTTLDKLHGQVVLVDFWTYSCYNCINTLPALKSYYNKYREQGFTIVGVETPEYDSEKVPANLQRSVAKHGIKYPVVTDYNGDTWRAYDVEAWPTIIILDKQGRIRYTHIGEGAYDVQEKVIRTLLAEK